MNDYETADLDRDEVDKALKAFENKRRRLNKPKKAKGISAEALLQSKSTRHGGERKRVRAAANFQLLRIWAMTTDDGDAAHFCSAFVLSTNPNPYVYN